MDFPAHWPCCQRVVVVVFDRFPRQVATRFSPRIDKRDAAVVQRPIPNSTSWKAIRIIIEITNRQRNVGSRHRSLLTFSICGGSFFRQTHHDRRSLVFWRISDPSETISSRVVVAVMMRLDSPSQNHHHRRSSNEKATSTTHKRTTNALYFQHYQQATCYDTPYLLVQTRSTREELSR